MVMSWAVSWKEPSSRDTLADKTTHGVEGSGGDGVGEVTDAVGSKVGFGSRGGFGESRPPEAKTRNMFITSQINILDDNVLLDEYSIIVASDADGVETITAHDKEVDQITKLN